jgi:hypothetical protein
MALAFHRATSDGSISDAEAKEIKVGLEAAFANITTPPAQPAPVQEPVSDYIKKIEDLIQERDDARSSRDFYKRRADALQEWQSKMRDPERTIVCDILANGCTLEPAGDRYTTPPAAQPAVPLTDEQIDDVIWRSHKVESNYAGWVTDQRRIWAKAIEAAHGIAAAPEKGQP